jgi:hypothetical protein
MRQNRRRPALKYIPGQLVLLKQHRASKWAPKWDGPFEIKTVISENTFRIRRPHTNQEDTVHIDYIRPYYSRDGSPAVGNDASFPEENDERSDNINYETEYLYEPNEDLVIEVETKAFSPPSNKVANASNPALSPRVTRSRTRLLDQQIPSSTVPSGTQNQRVSTNPPTKHKSVLSRARASIKKVIPKHVSFSRRDTISSARQQFPDDVDASASTHKTSVAHSAPAPTLSRSPSTSPSTSSVSTFDLQDSNSSVPSTFKDSHPTLTIDIISDQQRPVINTKITNSRSYDPNK